MNNILEYNTSKLAYLEEELKVINYINHEMTILSNDIFYLYNISVKNNDLLYNEIKANYKTRIDELNEEMMELRLENTQLINKLNIKTFTRTLGDGGATNEEL